jgi:hypothetical protein
MEEIAANGKEIIFFAFAPKYLRIISREVKAIIPPAKRKAGIRQVNTCRATYSFKASRPPFSTSNSILITPS